MNKAGLLCCAVLAPISVLAAELVVIESTAPNYELAQIVTDADTIVLEAGTEIILISEDGLVIGVVGPFDGPLVPIDTEDGFNALRALGVLVGQSEVEARDIGGVRALSVTDAELDELDGVADTRPSPWPIHAGQGGTQCVVADVDTVKLWRENASADRRLGITHLASGDSVTAEWPAGERQLGWPDRIPLLSDQAYLLRMDDEIRSVALVFRTVPESVTANDMSSVAWLAAKGCIGQARIALARLR